MEAEQRDLMEALKSWKPFLWSKAVTVGRPAVSSQNGLHWTGAVSAAIRQRGNRETGSCWAACGYRVSSGQTGNLYTAAHYLCDFNRHRCWFLEQRWQNINHALILQNNVRIFLPFTRNLS